jgi:hypothetical protein
MTAVRPADEELRWSPDSPLRLFRSATKFVEFSLPNDVYCGSGRPAQPDSTKHLQSICRLVAARTPAPNRKTICLWNFPTRCTTLTTTFTRPQTP